MELSTTRSAVRSPAACASWDPPGAVRLRILFQTDVAKCRRLPFDSADNHQQSSACSR